MIVTDMWAGCTEIKVSFGSSILQVQLMAMPVIWWKLNLGHTCASPSP